MCWANSGAEPVLPVPAESAIAPAPLLCNKAPTVHVCRESYVTFGLQAVWITAITDKKEEKETVWHTAFHGNISFVFPYLMKSSETSLSSSSDDTHKYTYTTYYVLGIYAPIMLRCEWRKFIKRISQSLPFMSMYGLQMRPVSGTCHLREMLDWFWLF